MASAHVIQNLTLSRKAILFFTRHQYPPPKKQPPGLIGSLGGRYYGIG